MLLNATVQHLGCTGCRGAGLGVHGYRVGRARAVRCSILTALGNVCCPCCSQVFLWPIGLMLLALPFLVLSGFNPTVFTLGLYFK